ncbi:MAG: hypothetical protein L3J46_10390, partial [Kangiellaceae bacterium]|nr:hypothetical protein [Kangiellaceae bacterium]
MNNMNRLSCMTFFLSSLIAFLGMITPAKAGGSANISLQQIEKDLDFLASDQMAGRGNFSKEIDLAADYVAKRFSEFDLTGSTDLIAGISAFKQSFSVFQLKPKTLKVILNGNTIIPDNIMAVSNQNGLNLDSADNINTRV